MPDAAVAADVAPFVHTRYRSTADAVQWGKVYPLVHSDDGCASWRCSATGWPVSIGARR